MELKVVPFKNVLVTGYSGLLGSWMSKSLLNLGCKVSGIALNKELDFLVESFEIKKEIDESYFDISNKDAIDKYFSINSFDVVIHLAAQTQVGDAILDPITTFKSNIEGSWNILDACKKYETPVVVASSDKAYGISTSLPYTEETPLKGVFPYEFSKSSTDLLCQTYRNTYSSKISVMRCGNIYGGGDLNWDRLIPGVSRWLLSNERPILRSNGEFKRDWIYVEDVVLAYIKLASELYNDNSDACNDFNFAGKDYLSVINVYEKLCNVILGRFVEPEYILNSDNEIVDQYLDSTKIKKLLNIESTVNFENGLVKTIDWYKANLDKIE